MYTRGMRRIFAKWIFGAFMCCVSTSCSQKTLVIKEKKKWENLGQARITTYSKYDDHWTRRGLTSSGLGLECQKTCAVDPKIIPYGSKVRLPDLGMEMIATDTGSAVKSRLAARKMGKNVPVVDIYFERKGDAKKFANGNPYFVDVEYLKPENES